MNVNLKNGQNEIVFDRLWHNLSILLLAAIEAKLIGPHGGLQVDKEKVGKVTDSVDSPLCCVMLTQLAVLLCLKLPCNLVVCRRVARPRK